MKLGRRSLLKASLGAAQLALLGRGEFARAQPAGSSGNGPTKILTLYLPGGWMSPFALIPWTDSELGQVLPTPYVEAGEPIFCTAAQIKNLDGSSVPGRIRVPTLWDQAELSQSRPDRGLGTSSHGWSWVQHQLWNNACIVHGVDQGTVAHMGGMMSAICGIASSDLKAPTINALVADRLIERFPDRPVPSVWINGPFPGQLNLRSEAAPTRIVNQNAIDRLLSDKAKTPWNGLRAKDINSAHAPLSYDGSPVPNPGFALNPIEERTLRRMRELKGKLNAPSEVLVEQLHDSLLGVSKLIARDVASAVQNTLGVEHTPAPFWAPNTGNHFGIHLGTAFADDGKRWSDSFNMALRLLKSDVCSAVAVGALGANNYSFDNGHSDGHAKSWMHARGIFEIIGRLLGEMKATPRGNGRTLLDETLVVVLSDFSRTLPYRAFSSDHWAANTVIFAGGGLQTNKTVGGYVVPTRPPKDVAGHDGAKVEIMQEGKKVTRAPRSADVVTTALSVLGISGHRIAGGNGEILGVRT